MQTNIIKRFYTYKTFQYFTYYLFILISIKVYAQDTISTQQNMISVNIGFQSGILQDQNFSPLIYQQNQGNYQFKYKRLNKKKETILGIRISAGLGTISTNSSDFFKTDILVGQLDVFYVKRLKKLTAKSNAYIGGQFTSQVQSLDWLDTESFSYFATHSLGIRGTYENRINSKLLFETSVHVPVVALVARPPYNGINETIIENQDNILALITNGTIESFNSYFKIDLETDLTYSLNKSFAIHTGLIVNYNSIYNSNNWTQLQVIINTGLAYNF